RSTGVGPSLRERGGPDHVTEAGSRPCIGPRKQERARRHINCSSAPIVGSLDPSVSPRPAVSTSNGVLRADKETDVRSKVGKPVGNIDEATRLEQLWNGEFGD